MKFRKVLIFISAVFLFASCQFMNQKDAFIQGFNESKKETGKVALNIGGSKARMIRPDYSLTLSDYSDWHVYFNGISNFDFELNPLETTSFELPVGNYNVLVTAVNKTVGTEGKDLILSSIQGKSEVTVVAGETAPVCYIFMERTKTENGTGSFEYIFKISKSCFSELNSENDPTNPEIVNNFSPINYIKASLTGLSVSENYSFSTDNTADLYVDVVSQDSETDPLFVFSLKGKNIKSGFYRLKIDFETSNNNIADSSGNVTDFYTKAFFEYPESLVEISDEEISYLDDTANEKIYYEEINYDYPITLSELSKLLKTCDKNDERILKLPNIEEDYSFPVDKINDKINKNEIKVDLTVPESIREGSSFSGNSFLYGVNFDFLGDLTIPENFFKDCTNLKYVRFNVELSTEFPTLTISQNAFAGCGEITFLVPATSLESYRTVLSKYFVEGNYIIEAITETCPV